MAEAASASLRALIATFDSADFVLETADNETGFKEVIKVKSRYQARVYLWSDEKQRKTQRSLPGLFDSAEEAAKYRALVIRDKLDPPPTKPRAPRGSRGDANAACCPPVPLACSLTRARACCAQLPRLNLVCARSRRVCGPLLPAKLRRARTTRRKRHQVLRCLARRPPRAAPWWPQWRGCMPRASP